MGNLFTFSMYMPGDNTIGSIVCVPCEALGEKGRYTIDEISRLKELMGENPHPVWTGSDMDRRDQLCEYSDKIRAILESEKLSKQSEDTDCDFFDPHASVDTCCPKCNREYDEVDFEYQICHRCNYDNSKRRK